VIVLVKGVYLGGLGVGGLRGAGGVHVGAEFGVGFLVV